MRWARRSIKDFAHSRFDLGIVGSFGWDQLLLASFAV
jgi:hypothetical protein